MEYSEFLKEVMTTLVDVKGQEGIRNNSKHQKWWVINNHLEGWRESEQNNRSYCYWYQGSQVRQIVAKQGGSKTLYVRDLHATTNIEEKEQIMREIV